MWQPKFLKPHAWYCSGCKKFEITPTGRRPPWVSRNYNHYVWEKNIIEGQDFGKWVFCYGVESTLAKFEGI